MNDLLDKNYIAPSRSAYTSSIVPALKKDGSICMCVDYRKLNKKTVKCNYPVACLKDFLEGVSGCDTFSVIDLRQAYRHIPINAEDREKTTFAVGDRKFEWLRMPFGLHRGSFSLAAAIVEILSDCRSLARPYYDDCIVACRGREQHLQHLEKIFQKFSSYCLHINLLKSQIMKRSVIFLGHIVSDKGIFPEASKVDEVVNFFTPSCASVVKSFLGMGFFFRKYIPSFSVYAVCLFDLSKKGRNFVCSGECQKSFDYIRAKLRDSALLVHPLFDWRFVIQCDASEKISNKLYVLRFNALELSAASYRHEDLLVAQENDAKLKQVI